MQCHISLCSFSVRALHQSVFWGKREDRRREAGWFWKKYVDGKGHKDREWEIQRYTEPKIENSERIWVWKDINEIALLQYFSSVSACNKEGNLNPYSRSASHCQSIIWSLSLHTAGKSSGYNKQTTKTTTCIHNEMVKSETLDFIIQKSKANTLIGGNELMCFNQFTLALTDMAVFEALYLIRNCSIVRILVC